MTEEEMEKVEFNIDYHPEYRLAQVYIPFQTYEEYYEPQEALKKGTFFPELYRPYRREKY
ncbi:spore coat associated protein CotJA [Acetohalobium arabaticum]|uniref:Spore coat associated protein JA (CotJA) n=1 Tax=Acetohalobium arabaticum (strain ATCC 49924 / DSM 5501 / Z-7288) TaxID=574087 RepID=D9QSC0_ACEAZ|nr:spore coat associated protein CotJA [Acetohalobium arabaticum]ADL11576.1 hypothetical protein Acear_0024 [Acetohalobium arabaticum DSM 5501]